MQYNHFDYGLWIATHNKAIKYSSANNHFFRSTETEDVTQLDDRLSQASGIVLVAIDGKDIDYSMNDASGLQEMPQYFFAILKQTDSTNDNSIHEAQTTCRIISKQIIDRMLTDREEYAHGLEDLDPSFSVRGVGPFADNFYGVMLGFNLKPNVSFTVDKNDWEKDA